MVTLGFQKKEKVAGPTGQIQAVGVFSGGKITTQQTGKIPGLPGALLLVGKEILLRKMAAIFFILVFIVFKEVMKTFFTWNPNWNNFFNWGIYILMLLIIGLTLYSGLTYLWENRKIITRL